jgi:hypothetical protein
VASIQPTMRIRMAVRKRMPLFTIRSFRSVMKAGLRVPNPDGLW